MLTLLLICIPLLGAAGLYLFRNENSKVPALAVSVAELAVSFFAISQFIHNSEFQFSFDAAWIRSMGIRFHIAMDGISMVLVLLTTVLVPLIILTSFRAKRSRLFYALILVMQSGLVGVFTSLDGFLFYVFWEIALIPAYLICLLWGGEKRILITFRFFIYTLAGSLMMLAALILIYLHTPYPHSFGLNSLYAVKLSAEMQGWVFWAMFIAFAIKMPVFPFHTWQPDTYTDAPAQGTMMLSGIMLKMGIYGLLRWLLPLAPEGVAEWGPTAMILSITGILYASLIAWMQKDFKRLIAYSSIAHVGLISAGIFSMTLQGLQGGMIQMLSHGIIAVGLFFTCEIIFDRTRTRDLNSLGGIRNRAPLFAGLFLVILLGSIGLPLTSGFIGEFLLLSGIYQFNPWMAGAAGIAIILSAVYMLSAYRKSMLGEEKFSPEAFPDLFFSEKITLMIIAGLIILLGVYPAPILSLTEPSIIKLISFIK